MSRRFVHEPVMLAEVLDLLAPAPDGLVLDGTVGGGGHAAAILAARPGWRLIGLDRDAEAVRAATERLAEYAPRVAVEKRRFDELADALAGDAAAGLDEAPGLAAALLDLGVSSPQLDVAERGFSYRQDAPLDMRMDRSSGRTAADICNSWSESELAALFAAHGEDRFARRIARAVATARPLCSTGQLAEVVAAAVPAAARRRGHPARRVFQALRVAVNDELEQLTTALDAAAAALVPGGRLLVLSYHSGEDRLVKTRFAELASGGCVCPPGLPCVCGADPLFDVLTRGARLASAAEVARNPRAEAARLRALARRLVPDSAEAAPGSGAPRQPPAERASSGRRR